MDYSWFQFFPGMTESKMQLFCFPHAGGDASLFHSWVEFMPSDISIYFCCFNKRLDRFQKIIPKNFSSLIHELADEMGAVINRPWAIFGHSMGGAVAHELVLELFRRGVPQPSLLAISGCGAPQFHKMGTLHQMSDEELCQELIRLDESNANILSHPEIRKLILPAIRADYRLIENYRSIPTDILSCPLAVFWGTEDWELTEEAVSGWKVWSKGEVHQRSFSGGHFYLNHHREAVVSTLCELLLSKINRVL
ncbi:TPA: thioesterase II family protein [Salmonella enterica subsp. enterica serovar Muenchen]|nr:thioesterase [Salmonella enterica subsp. enterica serovar Muenchen]ECG0447486.1 thioesterase [Salmonella enterica]ECJ4484419.1 thioesterase [Salmonella enterica subsp. diarizonae]EBY3556197.1 thioesterase [Salmonella enterica subsp. enterica serovar Muenchen]ECZ0254976.1 thioesterase [Salmonella enterica subsp. diarizonae]